MNQPTLFEPVTIDQRFQEFHSKNPQVYERLEEMSLNLHGRGRKKVGMKMLFEVMRWETMMKTDTKDYKLNNDYTSRYARLIVDNNPVLANFFETRRLHS